MTCSRLFTLFWLVACLSTFCSAQTTTCNQFANEERRKYLEKTLPTSEEARLALARALNRCIITGLETVRAIRDACVKKIGSTECTALKSTRFGLQQNRAKSNAEINRSLWAIHSEYKNLKELAKSDPLRSQYLKIGDDAAESQEQGTALGRLDEELHTVMREQNLNQFMGAILQTGVAFADTGNTTTPSATDRLETQVRALAEWSTKHWGDDFGKWDFGLSGRFGAFPVMTLVTIPDGTSSTISSMFQQGFLWDFSPQFGLHVSGQQEVAFFARVGQTRVNNREVTIDRGSAPSILATLADNNTGLTEHFFEVGTDWRLFDRDLEYVHEDVSVRTPRLMFGTGYRRDNRFKQSGTLSAFDRPADRIFLRMLVSITNLIRPAENQQPEQTFSIDFGVDHDRSLVGGEVPPATKFIIRADTNLVKLFRLVDDEGDSEARREAPPAAAPSKTSAFATR
jgi:hypothetical protein